uniref:F-box domain-containing protein n=1 Tax=Strongyloides venezuelensis TaxID=75913 RepID=A0A0K0G3Z4_STRVS
MLSAKNSIFTIDSLPRDVLLIILKKLEKDDIYNIRLTAKYLNFFVVANYEYLPRPKAIEIKISSCYRENESFKRVRFSCNCVDKSIEILEDVIIRGNNQIRFPRIERYLREVDLTDVETIEISTLGDSIVFDILSPYIRNGGAIENLTITVNRCPSFLSFSNFIQKIRYVKVLTFSKLCFPNQEIPSDYVFPMIDKMTNLHITECSCTNFVNNKMILDIFDKNEDLTDLAILSKCTDFKDELVEKIKERESECKGNEGNHDKYVLCLPEKCISKFYEEYTKYFIDDFSEIHHRNGAFNEILCVGRYCDQCHAHSIITLSFLKCSVFYDPSCDALI